MGASLALGRIGYVINPTMNCVLAVSFGTRRYADQVLNKTNYKPARPLRKNKKQSTMFSSKPFIHQIRYVKNIEHQLYNYPSTCLITHNTQRSRRA
jgi:hypothetical protein